MSAKISDEPTVKRIVRGAAKPGTIKSSVRKNAILKVLSESSNKKLAGNH